MSKLLVEEKKIVIPGQELAEGMDFLPGENVFRDGNKLVSMKLGLVDVNGRLIKVISFCGSYVPTRNDVIIGKVVSIGPSGWRVDIGYAFEAGLGLKEGSSDYIERGADLSKYFDIGDYIVCQVVNVAGAKLIDLSMNGPGLKKLGSGRLFNVNPAKVPRIIGKQGSMITIIKEATKCRISVGKNGWIWLSGENLKDELVGVEAIKKVEAESHISGLTDRIKDFLEKKSGK